MKLNTMQYKGYTAKIEYDDDDQLVYGDVVDLRDQITFSGETVAELRESFERAVETYLEWCAERGEQAAKPFSGKVQLRFEPSLHRDATVAAGSCQTSLNQFIVWCIKRGVAEVNVVSEAPSVMTARPAVYVRVQPLLTEELRFFMPTVEAEERPKRQAATAHVTKLVPLSTAGPVILTEGRSYALTS